MNSCSSANHSTCPLQRARRALLVLLILFAASLLPAPPASAHARLIEATPAAGSALAAAPTEFRLRFTEPVDLQFSRADLLLSDGTNISLAPLAADLDDPAALLVRPADPSALPTGTYTLIWRVLSATDGHATTGSLAVSIGTGRQPEGSSASSESTVNPPWWRIALRWVEFLSLLVITGGIAFSALILRPLRSVPSPNPSNDIWLRIWTSAASVGVVAQLLSLHDQTLIATGASASTVPPLDVYLDVLRGSTFGTAWLIRGSLLIALMCLIAARGRGRLLARWLDAVALALSAGLLLTVSWSGHAAGEVARARAIGIDWIHLNGAAIWLGGLVYLVAILRAYRPRTDDAAPLQTATLLRRFSTIALLTIAALIATGIATASFHVSGPRALRDQDYGRTLILKQLLAITVLIPAAVNLLIIVPRLRTAAQPPDLAAVRRHLRTATVTTIAELVLGASIIVTSAALTELPPADAPLTTDVAARIVTINQRSDLPAASILLLGRLAGETSDRFTISVTDAAGAPLPGIQRLIVETTLPDDAGGEPVTDRFDAEPMTGEISGFVFPALRLGLAALWQVELTVRRAGVDDLRAAFMVDTRDAGIPRPRLSDDAWRLPRFPATAWALFALALIVALGGVVGVKRLPGIEPLAGGLLLTMVVLITAGFAVSGYRQTIPITAGADLPNPVAADPGAVTRGSALYATSCLECHGPAGAGFPDQEADPTHGHGAAADLTDRRTRNQSDGDLYTAITEGVPGSVMPAYDWALTYDDRWDLVTYLRTLQEQTATAAREP